MQILFQSFLFWNYLSNGWICQLGSKGTCVSILLILELPLKHSSLSLISRIKFCFNPSYSGITSQTRIENVFCHKKFKFQSFLFWNYLSNCQIICWRLEYRRSFNPSYSGITSQTMIQRTISARLIEVSILLILELPLKLRSIDEIVLIVGEFQSFLFWNYLSNPALSYDQADTD